VRGFTTGLERFSYRPPRTRVAEVETAAAKATVERHFPDLEVVEIPLIYDTERYKPDPTVREQIRAELSAGPDDVVALYSGRNPHIKGLDLAVDGLADAHRRGADRLTLWVAGRGDPAPLARRHGLEGRVKMLGYRYDIERYLAAADLFLLPTIYEHGSRASHEAAACGLPLLVTATSGPAALIGDDEGGIVIERDPSSIGAALARMAGDAGLRRRMGEVARERMLAFNGRSYEPYFELYERLAADRG
jgi:glycosyltransferase involved in cell wall biosynthesis